MKDIELWHGDCLEMMAKIPDGSVDMVFADLPYGCTRNQWDFLMPLESLWQEFHRIGKLTCPFVLSSTQPFTTSLAHSNIKNLKYDIIWDKAVPGGFLNARRMPLKRHETLLIFSRKPSTFNPQKESGKPYFSKKGQCGDNVLSTSYGKFGVNPNPNASGERFPCSIVKYPKVTHGSQHPTQKPLALLEWIIKSYSNRSDRILDPTFGSGTTAHACVTTGRRFVGMEMHRPYYDIAVERVKKAMAEPRQTKLLLQE